jgi:hypothetical protein
VAFPLPGAAAGTPAPRTRAHIQRCDRNLLLIQSGITFENLVRRCALGKHVRHQVHRNPGPFEDGCSPHDIRVPDHHLFHARQLPQLALHLATGRLDLDAKRRTVSDRQSVGLRSLPEQLGYPPGFQGAASEGPRLLVGGRPVVPCSAAAEPSRPTAWRGGESIGCQLPCGPRPKANRSGQRLAQVNYAGGPIRRHHWLSVANKALLIFATMCTCESTISAMS